MIVVIRFCQVERFLLLQSHRGVVCWLEEAMTYAHTVEGMQEDDVCLTVIVNKYFVQIPPCHYIIYHQRIYMGRTVEIDITCIEGK
jgi:hypothetical protein